MPYHPPSPLTKLVSPISCCWGPVSSRGDGRLFGPLSQPEVELCLAHRELQAMGGGVRKEGVRGEEVRREGMRRKGVRRERGGVRKDREKQD